MGQLIRSLLFKLRLMAILPPVGLTLWRLTAVALACAVVGSSSYQPHISEVTTAFHNAGTNNLGAGYPSLPLIESGYPEQTLVPGSVPCVILKSVGYIESNWKQAVWSVPRGQSGPTLVSAGCGYGIMQITSGMVNPGDLPADVQQQIAEDYRYNIGWGAKMLVDKWNYAPTYVPPVGNRDPKVAENWYYTVWAYNWWTFRNNPNNPELPWPRPVPYSPDAPYPDYNNYPYQELVWGRAAYPPVVDGNQIWSPVALTLPNKEQIGETPGWIDTPSPSHESPCQLLSVSSNSLAFAADMGRKPDSHTITVMNDGGGSFSWSATTSASWLSVSPSSGSTQPATLQVSVNSSSLVRGTYNGTVQVTADGVAGSPQTISVLLLVGPTRIYTPIITKGYTTGP